MDQQQTSFGKLKKQSGNFYINKQKTIRQKITGDNNPETKFLAQIILKKELEKYTTEVDLTQQTRKSQSSHETQQFTQHIDIYDKERNNILADLTIRGSIQVIEKFPPSPREMRTPNKFNKGNLTVQTNFSQKKPFQSPILCPEFKFPIGRNAMPKFVDSPVRKRSPQVKKSNYGMYFNDKPRNPPLNWNEQCVREGAQWMRGKGPIANLMKNKRVKEPILKKSIQNQLPPHIQANIVDLSKTLPPQASSPREMKRRHVSFIGETKEVIPAVERKSTLEIDTTLEFDKREEEIKSPVLIINENSPRKQNWYEKSDAFADSPKSYSSISPKDSPSPKKSDSLEMTYDTCPSSDSGDYF